MFLLYLQTSNSALRCQRSCENSFGILHWLLNLAGVFICVVQCLINATMCIQELSIIIQK